jgi:hypothetical protein
MNNMEYKVITSSSPQGLNNTMNSLIKEGWEPKGSHQVVVIHSQNRYSGMQLMDTKHETEYSQTMVRETNKNVIEVDISFYHPDDNEDEKVYDEEGMREEFEYKLTQIIKNN